MMTLATIQAIRVITLMRVCLEHPVLTYSQRLQDKDSMSVIALLASHRASTVEESEDRVTIYRS